MNTKTTTCKNCEHPACFHCQHPIRSNPHAYAFHADRRARGIPPHGTRFKGDK